MRILKQEPGGKESGKLNSIQTIIKGGIMNGIKIITEIPGPKAQEVLKKDKQYSSPSYTRIYPLVIKRGKGAWVEDVDGNCFLDFSAGIAVTSTGHCHPEVVDAIKKQSEEFIHMSGTDFYYQLMPEVAEILISSINDGSDWKIFYTNSGTEAAEAAMKLARYYTGRQYFLSFYGSFHGRTFGALSLTASKKIHKIGFGAPFPAVIQVPYADCYRCAFNNFSDECDYSCIKFIENYVFGKSPGPENIAAIFVEVVQGEGGYVIPPKEFIQKLREITQRENILLVVDEIQSGLGRTGKMYAFQHFNIIPDIICVAKGIASGLPLGAMIAKSKLMTWKTGAHATTFGANPISLAAAKITLKLVRDKYCENAERVGHYLIEKLKPLEEMSSYVGQVRGLGLMIGIDIVKDKKTKEPFPEAKNKIISEAFKKGLLLLGCGESVIRLCPPLIITEEEANIAINIIYDVIKNLNFN